ncbi:unnamed protein product [Zymoseptoria tritici ST99CH_3D7]|uniref:Cyanovirin-N domain-containing protein n=1 Tax=Zymoseptoria tritici (strain ST99CH_3D7) TaxID=1276538 RepID=A0A1X7S655_ZYMT9|nr:unnamed protein product [Zymoseptoria tritici ST99CH_3D7]
MKSTMALLAGLATLRQQAHSRYNLYGCVDVDGDKRSIYDAYCPVTDEGYVTKNLCVDYGSAGSTHATLKCHKPFNYKRFWIKHWVYDDKRELIRCPENRRGALACMGPEVH